MEVDFDPEKVTVDEICRAVASGGYSASPKGAKADEGKAVPAQNDELKDMKNRLIASIILLVFNITRALLLKGARL